MATNSKNLRRVSVVITAQSLYHLKRLAAQSGWGEKDLGRIIDKLVRTYQASEDIVHTRPIKRVDSLTGRVCTVCSGCRCEVDSDDAWCKHCGAKLDLEW